MDLVVRETARGRRVLWGYSILLLALQSFGHQPLPAPVLAVTGRRMVAFRCPCTGGRGGWVRTMVQEGRVLVDIASLDPLEERLACHKHHHGFAILPFIPTFPAYTPFSFQREDKKQPIWWTKSRHTPLLSSSVPVCVQK